MEDYWQCPIECTPMPTRRLLRSPPGGSPSQGDTTHFYWLLQELKLEYERSIQSARTAMLVRTQAIMESSASSQGFAPVRNVLEKMQDDVRKLNFSTPRFEIRETTGASDSIIDPRLTSPRLPSPRREPQLQRPECVNSESNIAPHQPHTPSGSNGGEIVIKPAVVANSSPSPSAEEPDEGKKPPVIPSPARDMFKRRSSSSDLPWLRGSHYFPDSHEHTWCPIRYSRKCVRTQWFEVVCAIFIVLNVLVQAIAAEGEHKTQLDFDAAGVVFSIWFIFELFLRFCSQGLYFFVCGPERNWNLFDSFVVSVDLGEKVLSLIVDREGAIIQNLSSVRILRILRIVRVLKAIRQYKFFKDFRLMVFSLLRSFMALFWSIMIFNICVFVFSVYLCRSVNTSLQADDPPFNVTTARKLYKMFGSVRKSQFTLYKTVSGGVDWGEVADPLEEAHWVNLWVLCFYIFFTLLGVMNIITGIFVDRAIKSASSDSDEVIVQQVEERLTIVRQMQRIFQETDESQLGQITERDLADHLKNDRIVASFASIGIEVREAHELFLLLDTECCGSVDIDVFVRGCMKLKGAAKAIDLVTVLHESRRMAERLGEMFDIMQARFKEMKSMQQQIIDWSLGEFDKPLALNV